jgi:uncharacterized membrane protein
MPDVNRQSSRQHDFERKRRDMSTFRRLRNFWIPLATTIVLACFCDAVGQTSYTVTDLGLLSPNDNLSCAMALNNHGSTLIMNGDFRNPNDPLPLTARDSVNIDGVNIDLGTLGKPDSNTWMNWGGINDRGQAVGMSETSVLDPDSEDFCGFHTGLTCRPFLWQNGHMNALPMLGGNNGFASDINDAGQIAGTAQTTATDSQCPPTRLFRRYCGQTATLSLSLFLRCFPIQTGLHSRSTI